MKKLILAVMICMFTLSLSYATELDSSKIYPKYLLVVRYLGIKSSGTYLNVNSSVTTSIDKWEWIYLDETYDTIDQVLKRLNDYFANSASTKDNLVGLWELGEKRNIADKLKLIETKHKEEKVIKVEEWSDWKWEAGGIK